MKQYQMTPQLEARLERLNPTAVYKDHQQERFEHINEKLVQFGRQTMLLAPDCPEKEKALEKLEEFGMWLKAAVAKEKQ